MGSLQLLERDNADSKLQQDEYALAKPFISSSSVDLGPLDESVARIQHLISLGVRLIT